MKRIRFHDKIAQNKKDIIIREIREGKAREIQDKCDRFRFSPDRKERLYSAIGYALLAETAYFGDDVQQATYLFHYSGHGFRSMGMSAKAAWVYRNSYLSGKKASEFYFLQSNQKKVAEIYMFNLRSAGRAIKCFTDSGQFKQAAGARRDFHEFELQNAKQRHQFLLVFVLQCWKLILDYSLSWYRAALVFIFTLLAMLFLKIQFSLLILAIGLVALMSVCLRRLF